MQHKLVNELDRGGCQEGARHSSMVNLYRGVV
jgi:hypothetical protein